MNGAFTGLAVASTWIAFVGHAARIQEEIP
jgi:hypothetical protein